MMYKPKARYWLIRVYYPGSRKAWYVHVVDKHGRRRVRAGARGAERFERERDGLWVVITTRWQGCPVVEPAE